MSMRCLALGVALMVLLVPAFQAQVVPESALPPESAGGLGATLRLGDRSIDELFDLWAMPGTSWDEDIRRELLSREGASERAAQNRLATSSRLSERLLAIELLTRLCQDDCAALLVRHARAAGTAVEAAAAIQSLAAMDLRSAPLLVAPFLEEGTPLEIVAAALGVLARHGSAVDQPLLQPYLEHSDEAIQFLARFANTKLLQDGAPPVSRRQGALAPSPSAAAVALTTDFVNESIAALETSLQTSVLQSYSGGVKHLASFSYTFPPKSKLFAFVTVSLILDLDDFSAITPEGQQGWITYWLDVKFHFEAPGGASVLDAIYGETPFSFSLMGHERQPNVDDPLRRIEFTAVSGTSGAINVRAGHVGFAGSSSFDIDLFEPSPTISSAEFLATSGTVLKGEVKLPELQGAIGDALLQESGGVGWGRFAQNVIFTLFQPLGQASVFKDVVSPLQHRPFTSSDNPIAPGAGNPRSRAITKVRGGLDSDGDGFADNFVPPSGSGSNPTTLWDLDVLFFTDNVLQDDYRIKAVGSTIPQGWTVAARGGNGQQFGHIYDVFDGSPNSLYGTEWYVGCTPGAPKTVGIDFQLFLRKTFWFDTLLDTVTAAFHCATPPAPPGPSTGFDLTVQKRGASSDGSVSGGAGQISCDNGCSETTEPFGSGANVSLNATAGAGTTFSGWGGACTGTSTCSVTMTENLLVTASFNPITVPVTVPVAPSGLMASATDTDQISLSWIDQSNNEDGFRVQRRSGTGGWFQIKTLAAGTTSFASTFLIPDTSYSFRVYAFNEAGDSGFSSPDSATTFSDAPNAPSAIRAWALSTSKIAMSWDDTNSGSSAYEIEQSSNGSSWSVVGYNGTGDTSFTRTVSPLSTGQYRVRAFRTGSGYSGYSGYSAPVTVTACAPPRPPRHEDPYSGEDDVPVDRIFEWDGDDEVAYWDLHLGTTNPPPLVSAAIGNPSPGDDIAFDPGGLATGQTYYWSLVAHASCDPTLVQASDVEFFSTIGAPAPPQLLKPADGATAQPTGLVLDWANVTSDGTVVYELYFGSASTPPFFEDMGTRTEKLIVGLSPNADYYWRVVAKSAQDPTLISSSPTWQFTTGGAATTTVTETALQDAGLRAGAFGSRNYGGNPTGPAEQKAFGAGNDDNFYLDAGAGALRGAMTFDLSSIPTGSNIVNATLTLKWAGSSGTPSAPLDMFFTPYTAAWSEGSITWNNRPAQDAGNQVQGTFPLSGFNPTQNDLTALVQKWVDGTLANHGFEISIPIWESASSQAEYFFQKEWSASRAAELQITYGTPCVAPPAPTGPLPLSGTPGQPSTLLLDWLDTPGASSYDLYFGPSPTPSFFQLAADSSAQVTGLAPGTTYYWRVEARASCDASLTTTSPTWNFVTDTCLDPDPPALTSPSQGAASQPRSTVFDWGTVPGAGQYELYLGTTNPPNQLRASTALASASAILDPGTRYYWMVRAIAACDPSRTTSSTIGVLDSALAPTADAGSNTSAPGSTAVPLGGSPAASNGTPPYSYSWSVQPSLGAVLSSVSAANPVLTASQPGNYLAQLVVTDANGFAAVPATAIVTVPCHGLLVNLSGETIVGNRDYIACQALSIDSSSVENGGELFLKAGDRISLGPGLAIVKGGKLRVEIDPSLDP